MGEIARAIFVIATLGIIAVHGAAWYVFVKRKLNPEPAFIPLVLRLELGYYLVLAYFLVLAPEIIPFYLALPLIAVHLWAFVRYGLPGRKPPAAPLPSGKILAFDVAEVSILSYLIIRLTIGA